MSMFDPFKKLKLAGAFLGAAEDSARTDDNIDLSELFGRLDMRGLRLDVERILAKEGVRQLYESRYLPRPEPIERMLENGEGTLGYEVARYMRLHKLRPIALPANLDYKDPANYIALRVRMTHALMHVITEYDASPLGELALQSYYVAQLGNLVSGVIISSGLLQITRDMPEQFGAALEVVAEAYDRGREAKPLLGTAWEELWSAQVPQLRELIDLLPRRTAHARLDLDALEAAAAPPPTPTRSSSSNLSGFGAGASSGASLGGFGGSNNAPGLGGLAGFGQSSSSSASSGSARGPSVFTAATKPAATSPGPGADDGRAQPRKRETSQSSLLASFMALAEQESRAPAENDLPEAEPEPVPEPPRPRQVLRPPPPPPARQPSQPQPMQPPPQAAKPAPPPPQPPPPEEKPGFTIEESDPGIQPAQPGDPDFF